MSLADLFSALADPTRLRVLELLHDKPRPVHELAGAFDISRPAISRHLRVLREAGLVKEVKQGRENLYSFQRDELKTGIGWLEQHQRKAAGRGKKVAVAEVATVVAEAPVIVAEPIVVAEPVPVVPEPAAELIVVAKVSAPTKPRAAKPRVAAEPIAPPPPKQAPQLSLFDL